MMNYFVNEAFSIFTIHKSQPTHLWKSGNYDSLASVFKRFNKEKIRKRIEMVRKKKT